MLEKDPVASFGLDTRVSIPAREFVSVDTSSRPEVLLERLDRVETFAPHIDLRERTYLAIPGGAGVDVGCGHGLAVAELVERDIQAIGVDRSDVMVQAARRRFPSCTFVPGDATALPFPSGTMRWYRAERVYMHLPDPLAALAEARRVLAPGGKVIVADQDFDSTVITSADPGLTRAIVGALTDNLPHGRAGSRMPGLLVQAGLTHVTSSAIPMIFMDLDGIGPYIPMQAAALAVETGVVSKRQADAWMADLKDRAQDNQFLLAFMMFISTGCVPSPSDSETDEDELYV